MQSQKRIEEDCRTIDAITKLMNQHNSAYSSLYNWRLAVKDGDDFNAQRHSEDYALLLQTIVKPHVENAINEMLEDKLCFSSTDEDIAYILDTNVEKIRGEAPASDNMNNANKMIVVHLIEAIQMPCGYNEHHPQSIAQ